MPEKISISGDGKSTLMPKDNVQFRIKTYLGSPQTSTFLEFDVPAWPSLITKTGLTYEYVTRNIDVFDENSEYNITNYLVGTFNANYERLTLKLQSTPSKIKVGDDVFITASSGALAPINGNTLKVIPSIKSTKGEKYIDLKVSASVFSVGAKGSVTASVNSIKEVKSTKTVRDYTIRLNGGSNSLQSFMYNDYVRDVLVFGVSTVSTINMSNKKESPIYIIKPSGPGTPLIDRATAPPYSDITQFLKKPATILTTSLLDKNIALKLYCGIARYKKVGENWSGEWLQKDDKGLAILAEAKAKGA